MCVCVCVRVRVRVRVRVCVCVYTQEESCSMGCHRVDKAQPVDSRAEAEEGDMTQASWDLSPEHSVHIL